MAKTATKAAQPVKPAATTKTQPSRPAARASTMAERERDDTEHEESRAVATRSQSTAVGSTRDQLPDFMREDMDAGKENIRQEDMDIPRLKLIQGTSKELQLFDDLKAGHFLHTATEMIFDEEFRVVPVYFDRQYILWQPLEAGGGILARARDGVNWEPPRGEFKTKLDRKDGGHEVTWKLAPTVVQSGLANWGTMNPADPNSPPAATLMYNFLLAFPDFPEVMPAVLTFQRSSIKIGRKFMTKLKTVRTPIFGSVFKLSSFVDHNAASQDFHNINIVGDGLVMDRDQYEMYKNLYESLSQSGLNVRDVDSLQDDPDATAGAADPNAPAY